MACREALPGHLMVTLLARYGSQIERCELRTAMLFGGRKSRLRALVSPWHTGRIWLYEQKAGQSAKITDFDVQKYRHTFRENFDKAQTASLVSELVIKTKAAGGSGQCWPLVNAFLDGLDRVEEGAGPALVRFLWRYLDILGIRPTLEPCVSCGKPLARETAPLLFLLEENGFICAECAESGGAQSRNGFTLTQEARAYLAAVSSLDARESRKIAVSAETERCLKRFLFFLVTLATGERLKTLEISG